MHVHLLLTFSCPSSLPCARYHFVLSGPSSSRTWIFILLLFSSRKIINWSLCETDVTLAKASSRAQELPAADSFTNAKMTCQDGQEEVSQGMTSSSSSSSSSPCSEGSVCLEGDLGVYCQCYRQRSTMKQVRALPWTNMLVQFSNCNIDLAYFSAPSAYASRVCSSIQYQTRHVFPPQGWLHALVRRQIRGEQYKIYAAMTACLQTINPTHTKNIS